MARGRSSRVTACLWGPSTGCLRIALLSLGLGASPAPGRRPEPHPSCLLWSRAVLSWAQPGRGMEGRLEGKKGKMSSHLGPGKGPVGSHGTLGAELASGPLQLSP